MNKQAVLSTMNTVQLSRIQRSSSTVGDSIKREVISCTDADNAFTDAVGVDSGEAVVHFEEAASAVPTNIKFEADFVSDVTDAVGMNVTNYENYDDEEEEEEDCGDEEDAEEFEEDQSIFGDDEEEEEEGHEDSVNRLIHEGSNTEEGSSTPIHQIDNKNFIRVKTINLKSFNRTKAGDIISSKTLLKTTATTAVEDDQGSDKIFKTEHDSLSCSNDNEDDNPSAQYEQDSDEEYVYPPRKGKRPVGRPRKKLKLNVRSSLMSFNENNNKQQHLAHNKHESNSRSTNTAANITNNNSSSSSYRLRSTSSKTGVSVDGTRKSCSSSLVKHIGIQCDIFKIDSIKRGIVSELSELNRLFKLDMQNMLNERQHSSKIPSMQRVRGAASKSSASKLSRARANGARNICYGSGRGVRPAKQCWQRSKEVTHGCPLLPTMRVLEKRKTEDDTIEIVVCAGP